MNRERLARAVWSRQGGVAELVLWPLSLAEALYGGVVRARAEAYRRGRRRRRTLPVPVISVGNLAVGGTGKTPMVIHLAAALMTFGRRPGVLSRGYRGRAEGGPPLLVADGTSLLSDPETAGDEPYLIASRLPGVPVAVCADRAEGGRLLLERARPDVVLLDDGFQHLALARDAEVVLLDGDAPFGNGRLLPRGPLREPPEALKRADVVAVRAEDGLSASLERRLAALTDARLVALRTEVEGITDLAGKPAELAPGTAVFALCGIARPERFRTTVSSLGLAVAGFLDTGDHAAYGPERIGDCVARARAAGAQAVVTTAKDAVKLAGKWPDDLPLRVVQVGLATVPSGGGEDGPSWEERLLALAEARFARRGGKGDKGGAFSPTAG